MEISKKSRRVRSDTSHCARQADMDDMRMKRSAANKRDKRQRQNKDES